MLHASSGYRVANTAPDDSTSIIQPCLSMTQLKQLASTHSVPAPGHAHFTLLNSFIWLQVCTVYIVTSIGLNF